jgi:hypothetical protein
VAVASAVASAAGSNRAGSECWRGMVWPKRTGGVRWGDHSTVGAGKTRRNGELWGLSPSSRIIHPSKINGLLRFCIESAAMRGIIP